MSGVIRGQQGGEKDRRAESLHGGGGEGREGEGSTWKGGGDPVHRSRRRERPRSSAPLHSPHIACTRTHKNKRGEEKRSHGPECPSPPRHAGAESKRRIRIRTERKEEFGIGWRVRPASRAPCSRGHHHKRCSAHTGCSCSRGHRHHAVGVTCAILAWAPPCAPFLACAPCTRSDHSHCVPRLRCTYTHHAGRASLALARRRTLPCSLGHCLGVRGKGLGARSAPLTECIGVRV